MRAILTYHSIDGTGSPISVDRSTFRSHVEWLVASPLQVTSLDALAGLPASADAVAITFDDGLENFATEAWPLLRAHGLTATLFVVTDRVGTTNEWKGSPEPGIPTLALLDWDALGRLAAEGVELGSHTRTHASLNALPPARLDDELQASAERLAAETGRRPASFAYPYGHYDATVAAAVAGRYRLACTTDLRPLREHEEPHLLPRLDTYYLRQPGQLEAWGSVGFRSQLWLRHHARMLRQLLSPRMVKR